MYVSWGWLYSRTVQTSPSVAASIPVQWSIPLVSVVDTVGLMQDSESSERTSLVSSRGRCIILTSRYKDAKMSLGDHKTFPPKTVSPKTVQKSSLEILASWCRHRWNSWMPLPVQGPSWRSSLVIRGLKYSRVSTAFLKGPLMRNMSTIYVVDQSCLRYQMKINQVKMYQVKIPIPCNWIVRS